MEMRDKVARLEGEMKAVATSNEALKSEVNASLALLREDMAKHDADAAKRNRSNTRWMIDVAIAAVVAAGVAIR